MRVTQRIDLIDRLGRALQARYGYSEIDACLDAYGVSPPLQGSVGVNSKWAYSKVALQSVDTSTLLKIAEDLEVPVPNSVVASVRPPKNWEGSTQFRLFISHISKDKLKATRLKECLVSHSISGFVAHEDIHPTLEWQSEIERALYAMDALIAIHTPGFCKSFWTQQEVGFALGRGVMVISFKMGEDPTGFISKHQALARRNRSAEEIATEIHDLLAADERTAAKLANGKKIVPSLDDEVPF